MPSAGFTATVTADGVRFADYPFPAASVAGKDVLLAWADVESVAVRRAPPEVRTRAGETLFVPTGDPDGMRAAAAAHGVPDLDHTAGDLDVWDMLLEPFLDTAFTDENRAQVDGRLRGLGFTQEEIDGVRAAHAATMVAYNIESGLWDWVHLGLFDLLGAYRGDLTGPRHRLDEDAFARLYVEAQALARRGWGPRPTADRDA